jgi:hypothetical protein
MLSSADNLLVRLIGMFVCTAFRLMCFVLLCKLLRLWTTVVSLVLCCVLRCIVNDYVLCVGRLHSGILTSILYNGQRSSVLFFFVCVITSVNGTSAAFVLIYACSFVQNFIIHLFKWQSRSIGRSEQQRICWTDYCWVFRRKLVFVINLAGPSISWE